jgi:AAA15 family ATPase/GTPase
MAGNNHLFYFSVDNFKCFSSFELNNIGQFNLIAGDNNVGKTSLLEALLLENDLVQTLHNLNSVYAVKHNLSLADSKKKEYYRYYIKVDGDNKHSLECTFNGASDESSDLGIYTIYFRQGSLLSENDKKVFKDRYPGQNLVGEIAFQKSGYNNNSSSVEYLDGELINTPPILLNSIGYTSDILKRYSELLNQGLSNKRKIIDALCLFIPDINDVLISQDSFGDSFLAIEQKGKENLLPLTAFGDGTLKMMQILQLIISSSNRRVMIDEIDTGIYFLKMKDFLKMIVQACINNNVQLFATTHSKECLEAYSEALDELGSDTQAKSRYIRLEKMSTGKIIGRNYSYEQFSSSIELGNEIRI